MAEDFYSYRNPPEGPARKPFAITPHATEPLALVPKGIYVGGTGDIVLRGVDTVVDVTLVGVPAGTILPIRASHVRDTGTTATNLVALA